MRLHIPMTRLALVPAVVVVAACGDVTAPPPTVVGSWRLQSAKSVVAGNPATLGVIRDLYTFRGDGTFAEDVFLGSGTTPHVGAGSYLVKGYSVILTYSDGTTYTASWNWSTFTFVRDGFLETYEPDPCANQPGTFIGIGACLPAPYKSRR